MRKNLFVCPLLCAGAAVAHDLPVTADTSAAVVGFQLHFNTLDRASLMGLFKH